MVKNYLPGETWEQHLDVRSYEDWAQRQRRKPDGSIRLLVASRRSGKTWFLRGLANELNQQENIAAVLDLRDVNKIGAGLTPPMKHLLLDEPGERLERDARELLNELLDLSSEKHILLALTPAEYRKLRYADSTNKISAKSIHWLERLKPDESARMLQRGTPDAMLVENFGKLQKEWKTNPFLLELFLECAEADLSAELEVLLQRAIELANAAPHDYASAVLTNGLDHHLRQIIRAIRTDAIDLSQRDDAIMLANCGLVKENGKKYAICDPILQEWLPPPFRIHHISDVHIGAKSKKINDNKVTTDFAKKVDEGAGVIFSRDSYLEHLQQRFGQGTGPNLVIISGDLIEREPIVELPEARQWVDKLADIMKRSRHPFLTPSTARVVMTGGNHDVNRLLALRLGNSGARHEEFVKCFGDFQVPRLDLAPDSPDRVFSQFRFHDARMDIALFGSSAFGSEASNDKNYEMVAAKLKSLEEPLLGDAALDASTRKEIMDQIDWIDPGLVHSKDLQRFSEHQWTMPLRIAVLHHPVSPLPILEIGAYTSLLNAGAVKQKLFESDFQLVLHGHVHHAAFSSESWWQKGNKRTLHICSAASLGSNAKDEKNGFNEIDVLWEGGKCQLLARHFELNGNVWEPTGHDVEWVVVED